MFLLNKKQEPQFRWPVQDTKNSNGNGKASPSKVAAPENGIAHPERANYGAITRYDPRIRRIPFVTARPTFHELRRTVLKLVTLSSEHLLPGMVQPRIGTGDH